MEHHLHRDACTRCSFGMKIRVRAIAVIAILLFTTFTILTFC